MVKERDELGPEVPNSTIPTSLHFDNHLTQAQKADVAALQQRFADVHQFNTLLFGVFRAPVTFQRVMDWVLQPHAAYTAAYLDDVIIYSDTWVEHVQEAAVVLGSL